MIDRQTRIAVKNKQISFLAGEAGTGQHTKNQDWSPEPIIQDNMKRSNTIKDSDHVHLSGKDSTIQQTLKNIEINRIHNLEALRVKYGEIPGPQSNKKSKQFVDIPYAKGEDESSEQEDYNDMIKDYYDKKHTDKKDRNQIRLLSSKYKRVESNYSQAIRFGNKKGPLKPEAIPGLRLSHNPNPIVINPAIQVANTRASYNSPQDAPEINYYIPGSARGAAINQANASRSASKYSVQQYYVSGYDQKFGQPGHSSTDLYARYVKQLQRATELREKGVMIKKSLKDKQSRIIEAILVDNQLNKPKIQLHLDDQIHNVKQKKDTKFLEFAKKNGKSSDKIANWSSHVSSNMFGKSEESQYVFSNLKKLDQDAEKVERAISKIKSPENQLQYFIPKRKEEMYMQSIRAKFGFLEAI